MDNNTQVNQATQDVTNNTQVNQPTQDVTNNTQVNQATQDGINNTQVNQTTQDNNIPLTNLEPADTSDENGSLSSNQLEQMLQMLHGLSPDERKELLQNLASGNRPNMNRELTAREKFQQRKNGLRSNRVTKTAKAYMADKATKEMVSKKTIKEELLNKQIESIKKKLNLTNTKQSSEQVEPVSQIPDNVAQVVSQVDQTPAQVVDLVVDLVDPVSQV